MSDGNGQDGGNGSPAPGGQGALQPGLECPHHRRESLAMIYQGLRRRWNIPDEWLETLPKIALNIALKGNERSQLRALEVLRAMARDGIDAAIALDKIERLDAGEATERTELGPIRLDGGREL